MILDTHAMVWYLQDSARLSRAALDAIRDTLAGGDSLVVSAVSVAEVVYLVEKQRLPADTLVRVARELDDPAAAFEVVPFGRAEAETMPLIARDIVPDMPDRMIAATALHLKLPLVTRDHRLRRLSIGIIW